MKTNQVGPVLETMEKHKQNIEELSGKILYLEEKNLKNTEKYKKELKLLQHDIYFLKKQINQIEVEKNSFKNNIDKVVEFANEYNLKDIKEVMELIDSYKNYNKNNNLIYLIMLFILFYINHKIKKKRKKIPNTNIYLNNNIKNIENIDNFKYDDTIDYIYNYFNEFYDYLETQEKEKIIINNKYLYVQDIVLYSFNTNKLYEIVDNIKDKSYFYENINKADEIIKNNKKKQHVKINRKRNKINKPKTDSEKEEIIYKTIDNIVKKKETEFRDDNIYYDLFNNNRNMITRLLKYYDDYIKGKINRKEYKTILSNYENHNDTNISRHIIICTIFKKMQEKHLLDTNLIYKYWSFQYITKDKINRFVHLLNERIIEEINQGNIIYNDENYSESHSEMDSEIIQDFNDISDFDGWKTDEE